MEPVPDNSDDADTTETVIHETSGCIITRAKDCSSICKSGRRVTVAEGNALELAHSLGLPVPRVRQIQSVPNSDQTLIRMDFVEGESLEHVWPTMSETERLHIAGQLRDILTTMHSLRPPKLEDGDQTGFIGSCGKRSVRDCRRYSTYEAGPFTSESKFNDFLLDLVKTTPRKMREALSGQMRFDHEIVFSHGDLTQHNILVKASNIVALLDWEYSGWYPEYWDYVKFFERYSANRDWKDYADLIFPRTHDPELVVYQAISRWQKP